MPTATPAIRIGSILARNYAPLVRVLAESLREHHPDVTLEVFLVDEPTGTSAAAVADDEPFRRLTIGDLGITAEEYTRMASIYDVTELATAIKPWLLAALLGDGDGNPDGSRAIYLDPDIQVFSPLDELPALIDAHGIVVTPHAPDGYPRDGLYPEEATILAAGIYNLGFIGVGAQARPFLSWWQERLRRHCINDVTSMHFVDQRWVDFVPGMRSHAILRHPGYNVAYWNLHTRRVTPGENGWEVDTEPLRFFHFSGYSPAAPYLLSKHQTDKPRILLSERPELQDLCDQYAARLLDAGWRASVAPYGFATTAHGAPLDVHARRLYRSALLAYEEGGGPARPPEPPCPLGPDGGDAFVAWLNEPVHPLFDPLVPRYLHAIWKSNPGFHELAPTLVGAAGERFVEWIRMHGASATTIPAPYLATPTPRPARPAERRRGVLVIDASPGGDGELSATLLGPALDRLDVAADVHVVGAHDEWDTDGVNITASDVTIVCASPAATFHLGVNAELDVLSERRLAAVWPWALPWGGHDLGPGTRAIDEVWVPSTFAHDALARLVARPVRTFVPPVVAPAAPSTASARVDAGLPEDRFVFATVADLREDVERTGVLAVIEAFRGAFDENAGPLLVVAPLHAATNRVPMERVRYATAGRKDVVVAGPDAGGADLPSLADCVVSLHRSIAFGLPLAQAMAAGTLTMATAYGGNVDFMDATNSLLVPFVHASAPGGDGRWAKPDLASAARLMRWTVDRPDDAAALAAEGRNSIARTHGVAAAGARLQSLIDELRAGPIHRDRRWLAAQREPLPRGRPAR